MKDYLAELVNDAPSPSQARGVAREYLQARILGALQRAGAMIPLAFHGGTALRFLYASGRFSEDLDFALERERDRYDFADYLRAVRGALAPEGYAVELKASEARVVHSAFIRFPGLLYELGLSPNRSEVLAVKIEVDTNPPQGAVLATTVVRRYVVLQLQHHDQASLLAGKLHAVLQRPHVKGRDLYDLVWYLSDPDWPSPNLTLLNNALRQTGWGGPVLTSHDWRAVVMERVMGLNWGRVAGDLQAFVDPGTVAGLVTKENLSRLLLGAAGPTEPEVIP